MMHMTHSHIISGGSTNNTNDQILIFKPSFHYCQLEVLNGNHFSKFNR